MNTMSSKGPALAITALAGAVVGALLTLGLAQREGAAPASADGKREPLYWVAPMDPDYRRDRPGKSPMGMDLIPVYEENGKGTGTVRIAPEVVNNLGVRTAKAERRQLQALIRTVGYVLYDEDRLVHIHPRVRGWIETLHVKASGDPVAAGQPLYALYAPELVNAQEELLLALNRNNARLVQAAEDRLRALQLPDAEIATLRRERNVQQSITFHAPQAGVVDNLNIREGFYVQPGTTLMSIGSLQEVWVEAEIFERQTALVERGMPVTMSLDYLPGREWQGEVDYIYPSLDEVTRTLRVRLRFDNSDGALRPNMFAQVLLRSGAQQPTLAVPREAVIRTGNQTRVVLAMGEGRFKSVAVRTGRSDEQFIEVLNGIREGDTVVTSAQFLLDSESSKSSDFMRMDTTEPEGQWAEVEGVINSLDAGSGRVNISRDPIEKWQRPAATMDYRLGAGIDHSTLEAGQRVQFRFEIRGDDFVVTDIGPAPAHEGHGEAAQ